MTAMTSGAPDAAAGVGAVSAASASSDGVSISAISWHPSLAAQVADDGAGGQPGVAGGNAGRPRAAQGGLGGGAGRRADDDHQLQVDAGILDDGAVGQRLLASRQRQRAAR